jgi:fermentation-respiration switch protein FrsA (DUF1100 family)
MVLLLVVAMYKSSAILSFVFFTDFGISGLAPQVWSVSDVRQHVVLKGVNGNRIPMLFETPSICPGPFPCIVLYSGHGGTKEQILETFGQLLTSRGMAILAVDIASHGEKCEGKGTFFDDLSPDKIITIAMGIRESVIDGKRAISWLHTQSNIDPGQIAVMGESLGSYIALIHAANDSRIRLLVLNVLGTQHKAADIKGSWLLRFKRPFLPAYQASRISNCPVLMLNGKNDTIVNPEGSKMLYTALPDPKDIVWFDSGHSLPYRAREVAVSWIANHFQCPDGELPNKTVPGDGK